MKQSLKQLTGYTFAQVESRYRHGQISQSVWEAFCRVWEWSARRYTGTAGYRQECFWNKYGRAAFYRRMNKVRAAFGFEPVKEVA